MFSKKNEQEQEKEGSGSGSQSSQTAGTTTANANAKDALPLDWTRVDRNTAAADGNNNDDDDADDDHHPPMPIRYPWDVADISSQGDDTEIVIVGTAGQKITRMGTDLGRHVRSPSNVRQLVLRSHLIQKMEGLADFTSLELLELYDNMIHELQCLNEGIGGAPGRTTLRVLDMSYNTIRSMTPVSQCPHLTELYLANNKLKSMSGLKGLVQLRKIDLGANRIRIMDVDELSGLVNLEELWIGKNKIEHIQGLDTLTKLRRLDVQSNRLTSVGNLSSQVNTLEELYLAHNGINDEGAMADPTGLALHFTALTTLDLSRNRLTSTQPFAHMITLEDLWLSGNKIATFDAVQPLSTLGTRPGACLEELYLEYNPVANEFEYRKKLKEMIPSLQKIDATMIAGGGGFGVGITTSHPAGTTGVLHPSSTTGVGSTTMGGGGMMTREEEIRKMQEQVVARARMDSEEEAAAKNQKGGEEGGK